jgi:radical SAM superfamily enzyme YgiQ (UPF0313 family)
LVYPATPETYWSYRHALELIGKKALMPPLGLLTVAAIMGEQYEYRLVDLNVTELEEADLEWADLVMLSAMIVQRESTEEVIARCNAAGVPVVAGGPYPTACHEEISGVAHFVLGEGECTIPAFREDLEAGTPREVYYPEARPEMSTVPAPRFDLCDVSVYQTIPLQFSRGCPFDCEFCDIVSLFGRRVRTKSPEQFLREMDAAWETGFKGTLFIVDDNFVGNHRRVKELLRAIVDWQERNGRPFNFCTEASIDLAADEELLQLMVSAGFSMVFIGLETPVGDSLEAVGKNQNLRGDMARAVHRIQRTGIEVTAGFILGFDSDPPDIAARQIEFIQELAIPTAMVGLLIALPNTRLWNRLNEEGRMPWRTNGNNTHAVELNYEPLLPKELLLEAYSEVLSSIYEPRRYFARCLRLLRRLPATGGREGFGSYDGISSEQLGALRKSLLRQGLSRYGHWYWWFLVRGVLLRPRLIVTVVTMAIQGHHYFEITRKVARGRNRIRRTSPAALQSGAGRRAQTAGAAAAYQKSATARQVDSVITAG